MITSERAKLDTAIDQVARRLVAVPDDAELAARIVASLPERSPRWWWLMPQFAALGAIVLAVAVWASRDRDVPALEPLVARMEALIAVSPTVIELKPELPRTRLLEPLEPLEALGSVDFDRSLSPVAAPSPLDVPALQTEDITAPEPLHIAPIELADLPLSGAPSSPQN